MGLMVRYLVRFGKVCLDTLRASYAYDVIIRDARAFAVPGINSMDGWHIDIMHTEYRSIKIVLSDPPSSL
jgi:hypothetical protein